MKKVLCLLMCAVLTATALCACSKTEEFTPDYSAAIGAIFVNDQQELPENTKVYADFSDNTYSFDLDAACVYYFAAAGDVYYAGDQNFTSLSFGANLDDGTVGAQGTAAYCREEGAGNTVTAYYLYHDETGVYFDTTTYFDRQEISGDTVFTGIDYACSVTFQEAQPAATFQVVCLDGSGNEISVEEYAPGEVTDYQTFEMGAEMAAAEVVCYEAAGEELSRQSVTPEDSDATICFDAGGQILFCGLTGTSDRSLSRGGDCLESTGSSCVLTGLVVLLQQTRRGNSNKGQVI